MKIVTVVGTRPNFNKEMLINRYLKEAGVTEILVNTGQHYDYEMSKVFFRDCELPEPDYNLEVGSATHAKQTADIMVKIEDILLKEQPDMVLVYGDVNSTMAAALAAAKLRIPIAHIEAGPRNNIKHMPEEINRVVTDRISTLLFAPTQESYDNLVHEGYNKEQIFFVGDIMKDNLLTILTRHEINPVPSKQSDYCVATVHRSENTDSKERLQAIFQALIESNEKIVIPLHPRTRKKLEEYSLLDDVENAANIEIKKPLGYVEFTKLLAESKKVITDSGGVRREAYMLKKPVITVMEEDGVWWPEIVASGWSKVVGPDQNAIITAIKSFDPTDKEHPQIFGEGNAARQIVDLIVTHLKKSHAN